MEEVKSSLHSRELRCKAFGNTEETSGSGLVVLNSTKNGKKKKDKNKNEYLPTWKGCRPGHSSPHRGTTTLRYSGRVLRNSVRGGQRSMTGLPV
ncbi:hypothetical protein SESBI_43572 [Sesbania bispinosa]|nr:hypothetical protein SESBI_43572 [Sesbania bispinosa]